MSNISWSSLYNLSASDRQRIVAYIKDDSPKHQRLVESCSVNHDAEAAVSQAVLSQAVLSQAAVSQVAVSQAAIVVSQAVVSQAEDDWGEIGGTPWEILQDEFISKFGSQHDINLDVEFGTTDEAEGGIAIITSWLERNNPTEVEAEKARVWIARFQRCLAGEFEDDPNAFELDIDQTPASIDTVASASRSITTVAAPSALAPPAIVISSPAAVIDTATETAVVAAPTVAFSPIVSPVVVPASIAEPNTVSAHPIPVSIPTWAAVLQELQSKFGIEQEIAFDAEVHEAEAAITQLTEWMNTDFAEQASAWVAKLQLFLEKESALDSLLYGLEDTLDLGAPPPAPASIVPDPNPRINLAPTPRINPRPNLATNPRPSPMPMPPRLLSRPRQSTPPIVSRNLGPAKPPGLVRRHRSEVTESPPNTPT